MSFQNRLALQGLCNQIQDMVGKQDLAFPYHWDGGFISIMSGAMAQAESDFMKAVSAYLTARHSPDADLTTAREALAKAVEEWAAKMGY